MKYDWRPVTDGRQIHHERGPIPRNTRRNTWSWPTTRETGKNPWFVKVTGGTLLRQFDRKSCNAVWKSDQLCPIYYILISPSTPWAWTCSALIHVYLGIITIRESVMYRLGYLIDARWIILAANYWTKCHIQETLGAAFWWYRTKDNTCSNDTIVEIVKRMVSHSYVSSVFSPDWNGTNFLSGSRRHANGLHQNPQVTRPSQVPTGRHRRRPKGEGHLRGAKSEGYRRVVLPFLSVHCCNAGLRFLGWVLRRIHRW